MAPDGVHLLSDHTGRASGEAFVHFVDKESAQEALNRDREKIGHRWGDKKFITTKGFARVALLRCCRVGMLLVRTLI